MSHAEASLYVVHRVLLVLLVCLALLLGSSGDPECFVVPFLPKCFDDDDEEKKPDNTVPQASSSLVPSPRLRAISVLAVGHRHAAIQTPARTYREAPRAI
jgi:hypothetical protein